jgi:hypothetical protein
MIFVFGIRIDVPDPHCCEIRKNHGYCRKAIVAALLDRSRMEHK